MSARRVRWAVAVVALAVVGAAPAAPAIYKCTQGETTVFSPQPCGADAKAVDTSGALRRPSQTGDAVEQTAAAVADSNCRRDAYRNTRGLAEDRIVDMERERRGLEVRARRTNNNLAGATLESGICQQIAQIQANISQERTSADAAYRAALADCDHRRDSP